MATKLPATDVVIIGLGWTGSIIAKSMTEAGLNVVAIERGPWRDTATDFPPIMRRTSCAMPCDTICSCARRRPTLTFRNNPSQTALPIRTWGSFLLPNGVGGAGVHWNAQTWRFLPTDFVLKTHLTQRYGAKFLPDDMTIQDWGVTYDELEPHFDAFEYLCGTSGTPATSRDRSSRSATPSRDARSRPYPTPAQKQPYGPVLWAEAAKEMGYNPFPQPSGNLSQAYTNPLGVTLGPCTYCGFCERFGCGNYSKASPQTTILPVLMRRSNFEARTECEVTRINLDNTGKRATGVTYVDTQGREWEQPAEMVFLCAFQMFNVQLLLLSGIGQPYDMTTGQGVIGRNFSYQVTSSVEAFFDNKIFNPFIASGAIGMCIDEFNGDNFDHGPYGFVGGGYMGMVQPNARPIEATPTPPGTPQWGAAWKKAVKDNYLSTILPAAHGSCYSYRDCYLDLDPTYTDRFGRPLMRLTFDFHENELKMSQFLTDRLAEIVQKMGPRQMVKLPRTGHYAIVPYQTTHTCGGAIMGTDPKTSALNRYLQSWDVHNLFVTGATNFPQNAGYNPTGTIGALTYWSLDAIHKQYLKNPGPLVHA